MKVLANTYILTTFACVIALMVSETISTLHMQSDYLECNITLVHFPYFTTF